MIKEIIDPNPPTTLDQIATFENRWKIQLPEAYRNFLLNNNGGEPVPAAFPIIDMPHNPTGEIRAFFGLGAKIESEDLEWYLKHLTIPQIPKILPIAYTPMGDYLCLDTSRPKSAVIYWDRKMCWGDGNKIVFYLVAKSFEEFLALIDEYPPEGVEP
jgi:hypothetical protein